MMKLSVVFLFLIALSGSSQSQTAPSHISQPELQVIRFSWSEYRQGNSELDTGLPAPGGQRSQREDRIDGQIETMRQQAPENKQAIENLEEIRRRQQRVPAPRDSRPAEKVSYKYTLEVKSTSAKPIARVAWDYVFTDRRTDQEALRHSFESKVKIKPGGSAKITAYKKEGPYQVVDANGSSDKRGQRIVIKRIVYSDGSVWEG